MANPGPQKSKIQEIYEEFENKYSTIQAEFNFILKSDNRTELTATLSEEEQNNLAQYENDIRILDSMFRRYLIREPKSVVLPPAPNPVVAMEIDEEAPELSMDMKSSRRPSNQ